MKQLSNYHKFILSKFWILSTVLVFGGCLFTVINFDNMQLPSVQAKWVKVWGTLIFSSFIVTIIIHQISLRTKWRIDRDNEEYIRTGEI
jgi:predicted ABC-type exoprotein transport system permease subunit